MLFKRHFQEGEAAGVKWLNGVNQFQSIRLNVHVFYTDGVLIDAGAESLKKGFYPFFDGLSIDRTVLTHDHEDHTGGAAYLQQRGIPVYMNGLSKEACTVKADYPLYRKLFWGRRKPFRALTIDEVFESRTSKWRVIETPGHAADHLTFLNQSTGQLFTGDLYVNPRTKIILREESIPQIIASLEKVLTLEFEDVFCQHAGHVPDGRHALEQKLAYLQELQEKVLGLEQEGYTEKEIQNSLFPKKYPIVRASNGEWDSLHIIRSILHEG